MGYENIPYAENKSILKHAQTQVSLTPLRLVSTPVCFAASIHSKSYAKTRVGVCSVVMSVIKTGLCYCASVCAPVRSKINEINSRSIQLPVETCRRRRVLFTHLVRRADPNFTLGRGQTSRFRIVGQRVEERVLLGNELLDRFDVLKKESRGQEC
jgi:hypothetical protein